METWCLITALGLVAGALTTIAGIGGGLIVTLVLAAAWDPHLALAVAAPALLLGNGHRVWMYWRHVDRPVGWRIGAPAFAGAVLGGLVAAWLPDAPLRIMLLVVAVVAMVRAAMRTDVQLGRRSLAGGGALMGVVTATTGGGGLVLAPLSLAAGLRGSAFIATNSAVGVTVHVARIGAYAAAGMLSLAVLPQALALAGAITVGNLGARALRPRISERWCLAVTWASLAGGLVIAAASLWPGAA
jgi:uncharacterized membrane protein YfcA